jgi:hypothetical protein
VDDLTDLEHQPPATAAAPTHTNDAPTPDAEEFRGADEPFSTGDAQVDAALARLDELDERPLDEHVDVYADIHQSLGAVLDGTAGQTESR